MKGTRSRCWGLAASTGALLLASLAVSSCGEDTSPLDGSQCKLMSCAFTSIQCQGFFDKDQGTPKDLKVIYMNKDDSGTTYTAIISMNVRDLDKVEGTCLTDQEMLDRVTLYRPPPGEPWPDFTGNKCCISKGGDTPDKRFEGKCGFLFDNGRTLTARWSCNLENIED